MHILCWYPTMFFASLSCARCCWSRPDKSSTSCKDKHRQTMDRPLAKDKAWTDDWQRHGHIDKSVRVFLFLCFSVFARDPNQNALKIKLLTYMYVWTDIVWCRAAAALRRLEVAGVMMLWFTCCLVLVRQITRKPFRIQYQRVSHMEHRMMPRVKW